MKKETWKPVTISGFSGILMGAASAYGVQTVTNGEQSAPEQDAKTTDYDSMSFKDAFEAARAEMGSGHVFTWHGNVYTTYTAAEWNAKTHQEQEEFTEQVEPQLASAGAEAPEGPTVEVPIDKPVARVSVDEVPAGLTAGTELEQETPEHEETDDVRIIAGNEGDDVAARTPEDENVPEAGSDTPTDDNDVRILGYGDVQLANGEIVTIEDIELNGQRVRIIDMDKDGVADLAMSDLNNNQQPDEGEVIDLHTGETLSFTNDTDDVADSFTPIEI